MNTVQLAAAFTAACHKAKLESLAMGGCCVHVNAVVGIPGSLPEIIRFDVSDWYSNDSTVASYTNGKKRD